MHRLTLILLCLTHRFPADHFVGPGNVHFTASGTAKLADQVAAKIRTTITSKKDLLP